MSDVGAQRDQPLLWFLACLQLRGSLIVAHFALWVLSHAYWEAVGWLLVSWQWCHRLCQCESCPELG